MDKRRQNFISVNRKYALNSFDELFEVGEVVGHQEKEAGTATILSFDPDENMNEIRANTDKGYAHIDFLEKIKNG